jgi:hypothetical protein
MPSARPAQSGPLMPWQKLRRGEIGEFWLIPIVLVLESAAMFSRKAADLLKADCPTFSYEWFFGACGLDSWGELLIDRDTRR